MEGNTIPEGTARESLQEFLNETYQGGDWSPLIDYIKEHYISKDKIRDYEKALEWKRQQEIENLGMSMLGSAIDVLNKLLEE